MVSELKSKTLKLEHTTNTSLWKGKYCLNFFRIIKKNLSGNTKPIYVGQVHCIICMSLNELVNDLLLSFYISCNIQAHSLNIVYYYSLYSDK